jgi:UPF0755 protein
MFRILFFILLFFITVVSSGGYWIYTYHLIAPLPIYNDLHYTVKPNATLRKVAIDLMDKELINYPVALAWVSLARFQKRAHLIKAGEYLIPKRTTPQQMLDILISGRTIQHTLTIPEGWNFQQMMAAVRKHPQLVQTLDEIHNPITKKLNCPKKDAIIMAKLGWRNQCPEGRFYPDTYHFPTDTTDVAFLQRSYRMMEVELKTAWEKRDDKLPLKNSYEALILASIIEKETGVVEEQDKIAGVFVRRLKKNMLLQSDPTVIYALRETYDGNIRKRDLRAKKPHNTYVNKGLPPTPIAMPGRTALYATLHPAKGNALFFVAKGGGSHHFSATNKEHECAVIEYLLKNKAPRRYRAQCRKYPRCTACRS